jgi:hypothetical protein
MLDDLERVKRFERSTPTLARLCSTPELHPLARLSPQAAPIWPNSLCDCNRENIACEAFSRNRTHSEMPGLDGSAAYRLSTRPQPFHANPAQRCPMPKTQAQLFAFLADLGIAVKTVSHPALFHRRRFAGPARRDSRRATPRTCSSRTRRTNIFFSTVAGGRRDRPEADPPHHRCVEPRIVRQAGQAARLSGRDARRGDGVRHHQRHRASGDGSFSTKR